ncbi:chemotaxis protein CheD [Rhizobium leguminosarum]|uniref:chemotaxis protein CheD n=1 Tax=Rhizobium leguminosarum TaxID=384 RepID=UPI002E15175F|nr:chemotaxis protein CheD [Rhizobium leguminosarum]
MGEAGDRVFTVIQGEVHVTDDPNVVFTTPLGSCVSACIFDPHAGVGGMNHFLLVGEPGRHRGGNHDQYGVYAMPSLVTELLRMGGRIGRMQAWLFGGGSHFVAGRDVGHDNADFAEDYLHDMGIEIVGADLRTRVARSVSFRPATGDAWLRTFPRRDPPVFASRPAQQVARGLRI